jgi:hypothetical protein
MFPIRRAKNGPNYKFAPMSPPSRDPRDYAVQSHDIRLSVCGRAWLRGRPLASASTGEQIVRPAFRRSSPASKHEQLARSLSSTSLFLNEIFILNRYTTLSRTRAVAKTFTL